MSGSWRIEDYRAEAERFSESIERAKLLHFSGREARLEIEPLYDHHQGLFSWTSIDALRAAGERDLLAFAIDGLIGRATAAEVAEAGRREAALELVVDSETIPFRRAAARIANEPCSDRRDAVDRARVAAIEAELNPVLLEAHERGGAIVRELGWPSSAAMRAELTGIDLAGLSREASALLAKTAGAHRALLDSAMRDELALAPGSARRSDVPAFLRARSLDPGFRSERLLPSFHATTAALGLDLHALPNVRVDHVDRPGKAARAFCAPVRVPDEVHLVIPRVGGREDYSALFHEAGHTLHCAHMAPDLRFEHRRLGDVSVTEGFAFLFQHLISDPEWLRARLGIEDAERHVERGRAARLLLVRRYAAKLLYELELHGASTDAGAMPERYRRLLSDAMGVEWPAGTWLYDVDPSFYVAYYLRAWALEVLLRDRLEEVAGGPWHLSAEAGASLATLWSGGHSVPAEELFDEPDGEPLALRALTRNLGA